MCTATVRKFFPTSKNKSVSEKRYQKKKKKKKKGIDVTTKNVNQMQNERIEK